MPVIELALAHTLPPNTTSSESIKEEMRYAQKVLSDSSGYSFSILKQTSNSSHFFIVGAWDSVSAHVDHFLPSEANQQLLQMVKNDIAVDFMFHIDEMIAQSNHGKSNFRVPQVEHSGSLWIVRARVKADKAATFASRIVEAWSGEKDAAGGWRIENEESGPEWVMFLRKDPRSDGQLRCFTRAGEQEQFLEWLVVDNVDSLQES